MDVGRSNIIVAELKTSTQVSTYLPQLYGTFWLAYAPGVYGQELSCLPSRPSFARILTLTKFSEGWAEVILECCVQLIRQSSDYQRAGSIAQHTKAQRMICCSMEVCYHQSSYRGDFTSMRRPYWIYTYSFSELCKGGFHAE